MSNTWKEAELYQDKGTATKCMNKYYLLQQHLKRLQKDAVLHQYEILNWKNVSVSQWAGPVGPLDEWAILVIDGQGGAVRRNSMPYHVNIKLFHSYVFLRKVCILQTPAF